MTGRWRGARYSLRRQADLVKLAAKYGVEELLPPGKKSKEYKEVRRAEVGLRVRGTGIGQKVKGHKWERTMGARLEERRQAMLKMPEMIREWKQVSLRDFSDGGFFFPFFSDFLVGKCLRGRVANENYFYSVVTVVDGRSIRRNKARMATRAFVLF